MPPNLILYYQYRLVGLYCPHLLSLGKPPLCLKESRAMLRMVPQQILHWERISAQFYNLSQMQVAKGDMKQPTTELGHWGLLRMCLEVEQYLARESQEDVQETLKLGLVTEVALDNESPVQKKYEKDNKKK